MLGLYRNRKDKSGSYIDRAPGADIGRLSRRSLGVSAMPSLPRRHGAAQ